MGTFSLPGTKKDLLKIERDVMPVEYAALWRELALAYHLLETDDGRRCPDKCGLRSIQLCRLVKLRKDLLKSDAFEETRRGRCGARRVRGFMEASLPLASTVLVVLQFGIGDGSS